MKFRILLVSLLAFGVCTFNVEANELSEEIADKYNDGEYLSSEDQKIIEELMESEELVEGAQSSSGSDFRAAGGPSGTYNFQGSNAGVHLNGYCNYNFWTAPVNLKFDCNVSSTNNSIKSSNSVSVRHIGYGVGLNGGIFKAYDETFSNSNSHAFVSVLPNVTYNGIVAYGTFSATASSDGKSVTRSGRTN